MFVFVFLPVEVPFLFPMGKASPSSPEGINPALLEENFMPPPEAVLLSIHPTPPFLLLDLKMRCNVLPIRRYDALINNDLSFLIYADLNTGNVCGNRY